MIYKTQSNPNATKVIKTQLNNTTPETEQTSSDIP